jgi:CBS domain-containing protein
MKVKDLMAKNVKSCREGNDLATVAQMMWEGDCGIVPVVDDQSRVVGVITDRDICIAAATRSLDPASISAREAMSRNIATCSEDADLRSALSTLKDRRIRRLPVVNRQNQLVGVLSLNDLVGQTECRQGASIPGEEFLSTLRIICAHPAHA